MFTLNRELVFTFQRMHTIRVPSGTKVRKIDGGSGGFAVDPHNVELLSKTDSLFKHDATYYYIWLPADAVDEVSA